MLKPDKIIYSNRKSFGLEIDDMGVFVLRVPKKATEKEIKEVLVEKKRWIVSKKTKAKTKKPLVYSYDDSDEYFFLGKKYPLRYDYIDESLNFDGEKFVVDYVSKEKTQEILTNWYKDKALKISAFLTDKYADKLGIKHKKVKITSAKTRWGSCSTKKNININWRLVLAPLQVLEYVIAHEVAHLKYMDHSSKFWDTVEELQPQYKTYKKWLKDNHHLLNF